MENVKERAEMLILELSLVPYYMMEQKRLSDRISELEDLQTSIGRGTTRLTREQEKSDLPMPVFHGGCKDASFERYWKIEKLRIRLEEVDTALQRASTNLSYLSPFESSLVERVYIDREKKSRVAEDLGITRQSLERKLKRLVKAMVISHEKNHVLV